MGTLLARLLSKIDHGTLGRFFAAGSQEVEIETVQALRVFGDIQSLGTSMSYTAA